MAKRLPRTHFSLLLGILLLTVCWPLSAQTTGGIRGTATDSDGAMLPGVTVQLEGDPIPGAGRSAATNEEGSFSFRGLPAGSYLATGMLDGFREQTVAVRVPIDSMATVTFRLAPELTEEINVTGDAPLIDLSSPTANTTFSSEFVEALPKRANFYEVIAMAPAVSAPNEGSAAFSTSWAD